MNLEEGQAAKTGQWFLFACWICLLVHCVMWDLFPLQPNGEEADGQMSHADSREPGVGTAAVAGTHRSAGGRAGPAEEVQRGAQEQSRW